MNMIKSPSELRNVWNFSMGTYCEKYEKKKKIK